jgi:hypothetical protein
MGDLMIDEMQSRGHGCEMRGGGRRFCHRGHSDKRTWRGSDTQSTPANQSLSSSMASDLLWSEPAAILAVPCIGARGRFSPPGVITAICRGRRPPGCSQAQRAMNAAGRSSDCSQRPAICPGTRCQSAQAGIW